MRVSYNWLKRLVDLEGISPQHLAEQLTRHGVAVDVVERINLGVKNVVVGLVEESEKHPNSDKLHVCKVNVGNESLQIVCGASNVAKGQKVPVALIGAYLPNNVIIKETTLRGVKSEGMICSSEELGLNTKLLSKEKTEGILVLEPNAKIGDSIEEYLGLDDYVLELDLTPNRSDCLSMLGVAYEVAAIFSRKIELPKEEINNFVEASNVKIRIRDDASDYCPIYQARVIRNIKIAESPQWLQNFLIAAGIRPINNIVDITNYVMLEYGQPLHAFDLHSLSQPEIEVRLARENEEFITLDGVVRTLDQQMLLITDGIKPIALGGVMGGLNSEVKETTSAILLESAYFLGSSIRRTAKKLSLRSEASLRFEKGVDPERINRALNRACYLISELAGGEVEREIYRAELKTFNTKKILFNTAKLNKFLGTNLADEDVLTIFQRLGFKVVIREDNWEIEVPTRRADIAIVEDLYEEIARIYGYDQLPITLPIGAITVGKRTRKQKIRNFIRDFLTNYGLNDCLSYSLVNEQQVKFATLLGERTNIIELQMPLSEDRKVLRNMLYPNLLEIAKYNNYQKNKDIAIFELGSTFYTNEYYLTNLPEEKTHLALLLTGQLNNSWQRGGDKYDFYFAKGIIEELLSQLGISDLKFDPLEITDFHPTRTAAILINGEKIGFIGQLHPKVAQAYDLEEVYILEIEIEKIEGFVEHDFQVTPLAKYPAITRDIALTVDEEITNEEILEVIYQAGNWIEKVELFDVYRDKKLGEKKKSMAYSIVYRHRERTLTDQEIIPIQENILNKLHEKFNAELR